MEQELRDRMTKIVLESVENRGAVKNVELAVDVLSKLQPIIYSPLEYASVVTNLVVEGKLIELEYTLPNMPYRTKSIYFPGKTRLNIIQ